MVEEVPPEEVKDQLDDEDLQVVDTRPAEQYAQGHIPGAINIPFGELPQRIEDVDWSDHVVVACPIGQSSVQAARLIESYEGVEDEARIASMEGGYDQWEYDLETTEEEETADEAPI